MSPPSLPMVPQWLEMALGVGILLGLEKMKAQTRRFGIWLPPLSLLCYDRASVRTCVNTHTVTQVHFFVIWITRSAVGVMAHNTQHNDASLRIAPIW